MSKTETFSNSTDLAVINEKDKNAFLQISTVVRHAYHVALSKGSLKRDFLDIYLTTLSEFVISQIQNL